MKLDELMLSMGFQVEPNHYALFSYYIHEMVKRDRVMLIKNEYGHIEAVVIFYITNDYSTLYKKPMWKVARDEPNGTQAYIDKMVCCKWTKELRQSVQSFIQDKFPQVEEAYYHRAPKDRCVKIKRSEKYEPIPS